MLDKLNCMQSKKFKSYSRHNLDQLLTLRHLPEDVVTAIRVVSAVFPFRINAYVIDELIDWSNIPTDPLFQLTFPQPGMLGAADYRALAHQIRSGASEKDIRSMAARVQSRMNPHPGGQMALNVPRMGGEPVPGMQHKYTETVLYFPRQGQTCHTYCTYCFRWAQFVWGGALKFAGDDPSTLVRYLDAHPEVTDLLLTGGDPMVMSAKQLRKHLGGILKKRPGNLSTIRIGSKVLAYWPYRFLTDRDADDVIQLFDEVISAGYHLTVMSHFSHPRELSTEAVRLAMKRLINTGVTLRCQAPVIRHINDHPDVWAEMWRRQVAMGAIPYYMFVERDTGPRDYFHLPLASAYEIFTQAYRQVSGLCRTVRGPSMSATPGKVLVDGITEVAGEKVFALKFIQARNPEWVNRVFFARFDGQASWLDALKPAFGETRFFFETGCGQGR
ncbi:MAG: lysine 2,3-aminomutase [Deltaproteobacteria bacterium]|nr:MAG: lysine 2,3-aminomutase [Deltaproteobacteria bacterium]